MSDCEKIVFEFLEKSNRPYSQNDIQANLKDFGKAGIVKALAVLVKEGRIIEKVYGKQKIYFVNQSLFQCEDDSSLQRLCAFVQASADDISVQTKLLKEIDDKLKKIQNVPTQQELEKQIEETKNEIELLKSMINANNHAPVPQEEFSKVKAEHLKLTREIKKRKDVVRDVIDCILDSGYNGNRNTLIDDLDLEM